MARTGSPSHRRPLPTALAVAIGVVLACGLAGTTPAGASPPATAGSPGPVGSTAPVGSAPPRAVRADCPPVPLWANTGRRAATGAGALVTLGFAALATRYDRTRGTGRS